MPLWTPGFLGKTVCLLWVNATDITGLGDGDPVSTWSDRSGNAKHLTNTLTERPLYKTHILNDKPVVRFDGSDDDLGVGGLNVPANASIFVVFKTPGDTTSDQRVYNTTSNRHVLRLHQTAGNAQMHKQGTDFTYTTGVGTGTWEIHSNIYNGASSIGAINGTATTGTVGAGSSVGTNFTLGSSGAANWADLDVGELFVLSGAVSTGVQEQCEGYLAHKWGLAASLPGGHTYAASPPRVPLVGGTSF